MNNKTYDELYKEDVKKVTEWINNCSPFNFHQYKDKSWEYCDYYITDAISDYVNPTLNPNLLYEATIKEIERLHKNLYKIAEHRQQMFKTNIGTINASYCFINDNEVIFYNQRKIEIASFLKDNILFIQDIEEEIDGYLDIITIWER